jgi:hypothetical protein
MSQFTLIIRMRSVWRHILVYLPCGLLFVGGVCDESLPPYRDPENVFSGELRPEYIFYNIGNFLDVQILIVNTFDETFSAPSVIEGSLEISLERDPDFTRVFPLSTSNIRIGRYNSGTGILTMDPGDTLKLGVQWNFIDGAGRDFRQIVFEYIMDPDCPSRMLAKPETLIIRGNIKLYARTAAVNLGPRLFSFCHIDRWIDPRSCVTITPAEACSIFQ